uniref:G-protein coupled receptors family 1 profile domain-containing protein n=1 Tax=Globodera rostochiensis TaxID=31243 RepID=A0A914HTV4_GLORO
MNLSPQQKKIEQISISTDSKGYGSEQQIVVSGRMECVHLSEVISAHGIDDWTNYPLIKLVIMVAYATLFLFGLFSNGSVLMAFGRANRIRSTRNFFLLNLILTDNWVFGPVLCRFVPLCNSCAVFVTSWSLTAIAFDKHMHIVVDPTRRRFSRRLIGFVTLAIWLMSLVVNIPYLLSFELVQGVYMASQDDAITPFCDTFCDEFNWESESRRQFYGVVVLLFQFVVPLTVITFCHLRILRKVQKDMIVQNVQFRRTLTNSQRMDAINRKRRVNYTLLGMVVAFIGCNAPLTAVNLAKDFGWEPEFLLRQPYLCPLVAHLVAMSTVCWNPILFAWLGAKDKDRGTNSNAGMLSVGPSEMIANRTPCSLAVVVGAIRRLSRGELTAAEPNWGQQRERKNIPMVSAHFRNKLLENGKMSSKDSVGSLPVAKLKPMNAGENPSLVVPNRRRMSTNSNTF